MESTHFRVHYYQGLNEAAHRVIDISEAVYERIAHMMDHRPSQIVEIVLTDNTDDANGSASAVPLNNIRLFVTAPEDLSTLGDFDDWLQTLVTHEYTHIAHTDNIRGIPAIINAIIGKTYPPNQVQPRWLLEGIAVSNESYLTSGGRLDSPVWDMYLRADALSNHFVTIDQMSTGPNRWPHGNVWYLYGGFFVEYMQQRFGRDTFGRVSSDYGGQLIPYGINRSLQRATGHTWEELWPEFLASTRQRYEQQRAAIVARGVREGERITFQGEDLNYPRFYDAHTVVYQSGDGHSHWMFRSLDITAAHPRTHEHGWVGTPSGFAFSPEKTRMIRSEPGFHRGIYGYRDLWLSNVESDPSTQQLTTITDPEQLSSGARTLYPDWSPDGDHLVYTVNHRGTQQLFEYSLADHAARPLVRVRRFEQAYTPKYSPDGRYVAFSHWQRGGFRDIRVFDRQTQTIQDITHDRASDLEPTFTPDGRYLIYASDRTGVSNLYAYERSTGLTRQITNVVMGAFMPEVSPDGQWIVYVGYTWRGFDLFRLRFNPSQWLEPGPERSYNNHHVDTPPATVRDYEYTPWPTMRPRTWQADISDDGFGPLVSVSSGANDILGRQSWSARASLGLVGLNPGFDLAYSYSGLRPTVSMRFSRSVSRATWVNGGHEYAYPLERWVGDVGISVGFPSLFFSNSLSFGFNGAYAGPIGAAPGQQNWDPTELAPALPGRQLHAALRAGWSFSRVQRYTYDISAHEGFEGSVSMRASDRALGGAIGGFDINAAITGYVPMPLRVGRYQHVLALRAAGGVGTSDTGERGYYALGGYPLFNPVDFVSNLPSLGYSGSTPLRGYPPNARGGSSYYQCSVEYRFPIVQIDRGVSTLPIYIARLWGAVYVDAGDAWFGQVKPDRIAVGAGTEVFLDVVWGYVITTTMRFGVAQGLRGSDAQTQYYGLLGVPF